MNLTAVSSAGRFGRTATARLAAPATVVALPFYEPEWKRK